MCGGVGGAVGVDVGREMGGYSKGGGGSVHFPMYHQLRKLCRMAAVVSCNRAYSMRWRKRRRFSED
jgi:hypothetical protein